MKYKILTKYTSVLNKDFYEIYSIVDDFRNAIISFYRE